MAPCTHLKSAACSARTTASTALQANGITTPTHTRTIPLEAMRDHVITTKSLAQMPNAARGPAPGDRKTPPRPPMPVASIQGADSSVLLITDSHS